MVEKKKLQKMGPLDKILKTTQPQTGNDSDLIGTHQCQITSCELKHTEERGHQIVFELKIMSGDHSGRKTKIFASLENQERAAWTLGIFVKLGFSKPEDTGELEELCEQIEGTYCEMVCRENGQYVNKYIVRQLEESEIESEDDDESSDDEDNEDKKKTKTNRKRSTTKTVSDEEEEDDEEEEETDEDEETSEESRSNDEDEDEDDDSPPVKKKKRAKDEEEDDEDEDDEENAENEDDTPALELKFDCDEIEDSKQVALEKLAKKKGLDTEDYNDTEELCLALAAELELGGTFKTFDKFIAACKSA